jgi:hypothetical protein
MIQIDAAGNQTKYCPRCKETKLVGEFGKARRIKDGHYSYCMICENIRSAKQKRSPEGQKHFRDYRHNRRMTDPEFYWGDWVAKQTRLLFHGENSKHSKEYFGCTFEEWKNYSQNLWEATGHFDQIPHDGTVQIHHIVPRSYGYGKSEQVKAAILNYRNLIPMTIAEHDAEHARRAAAGMGEMPIGFTTFEEWQATHGG